tara:strand:- start:5 stop:643 length:639 start_codon:yes stop_codon:yes gene_type:complete
MMKKNMRAKGKIRSWHDEKGFGFITPNDGGKQLFVHIKAFKSRQRPQIDQVVTYTVSADKMGRACAEEVTRAGELYAKNKRKSTRIHAYLISIVFMLIVSLSALTGHIPVIVLPYYLGISVLTFAWYWKDKLAAQNGDWRTPETTLHLLALLGGWPGGMIAQQTLRHKSKKPSFKAMYWVTVLINCGVLIWFHSFDGRMMLNQGVQMILDTF